MYCPIFWSLFTNITFRYFVAASPSSIERHVYSAKLPDPNSSTTTPPPPTPLTDDQQVSWYSASFSPKSGFYALSYSGPNVPWQKVLQVGKKGKQSLEAETFWLIVGFSRFPICIDGQSPTKRNLCNVSDAFDCEVNYHE